MMANLIEYVKWRGDLPFDMFPLCEIDAAILSQVAYWNMDGIVPEDPKETMSMTALCQSAVLEELPPYCSEEDRTLKELLGTAERFKDLTLSGFVNEIDPEQETQFAAVTFSFGKKKQFVAFRGTDDSLAGWKECMDLAYYEEVKAQQKAVRYLEQIAAVTRGELYIGGHSKGGNLAVYAGAFCPDKINHRIMAIYNFDGPGFNQKVLEKDLFKKNQYRVHTFLPQDSLVGMLLIHQEAYQVVHSNASNGISQHHLVTWECGPKQFVYAQKLTEAGENTGETIREWLDSMSYEEKQHFIAVLYDLVDEYKTVGQLFTAKNLYKVMQEYRGMDKDKKKIVADAVGILRKSLVGDMIDDVKDTYQGVKETYQEVKEKVTDKIRQVQNKK